VIAKYRRFAFDGIFKGIEQIATGGRIRRFISGWRVNTSGAAQNTFDDLLARISRNAKLSFGWLIINETLFDVSPKGFFDMIEHAHFIRGKTGTGQKPWLMEFSLRR